MNYPNFFIVGAPKCGTTALSDYLRTHPNIFMSIPKEPSYFADDFPGVQFVKTQSDYLKLFTKQTALHIALGEASPAYLFSRKAIDNIWAFNPQTKIIVMLRNPVDMLLSYHAQLVYSLFETVMDFEIAWHLQNKRTRGIEIPRTCREPMFLQYAHVASFGKHMQRIYALFPRNQVKVIMFDDFTRYTQSVYQDILEFLGVPKDERTHFPVVNERKRFVSPKLNRALHFPPKLFYRILNRLNSTPIYYGLLKCHEVVKQANSKPMKKKIIPHQLKLEILSKLRSDIAILSEVIERDLSHWISDFE